MTISEISEILSPLQRSIIRMAANQDRISRLPVVLVAANKRPIVIGDKAFWTTPSGKTLIKYPGAYHWPTWYHPSSKRVEVGVLWVLNRFRSLRKQ